MSDRNTINTYLTTLSRFLGRLDENDASEILKEVESHIYDAIEQAQQRGNDVDVDDILSGFGSPRQLAESYCRHVIEGTPPPAGFAAIKAVKQQLSKGLYYSFLATGYGLSLLLAVMAVIKLLYPEAVGMWSAAGGNSVVFGFVEPSEQYGNELLGAYFSPIALAVSIALGWLTRKIHNVLGQHVR